MTTFQTRLHSIEWLASGISAFDFRPLAAEPLPPVVPGAHIDVHLPQNLVRSYSLVNQGETHRYLIGVNRDARGRGGSRYMHETLRVGDTVAVSAPRSSFPLNEQAAHSVLIAGGIGITPLWSMIQRLAQQRSPWQLYYSARARDVAAYAQEVEEAARASGGQVTFNFDEGEQRKRFDLRAIVDASPADTDFYCCGPASMIQAFDQATSQRDAARVHREYFAAPVGNASGAGAAQPASSLTVHLARSGKCIEVGADTSILDAVLNAGIEVPYSCMSGICGACEARVLDGVPDHQDFVLSEADRANGSAMMICCSRAKTASLTLDL